MNITTKGRYALRVMMDLAQHPEDGFVSLKTVAERQDISMKYLEMIVGQLKKAGLVESSRGKEGGYRLCRESAAYSVGEILERTEGSLAAVACLEEDAPPCPRAGVCRTLPMWREYDEMIRTFFRGKTLRDLLPPDIGTLA